jgi:hypothetical protein
MRFFLAGIMQGSLREAAIHDQDYRRRLAALIAGRFPQAEVYDPLAAHGQSLEYDEARGREVFFAHNRMCGEVDVLLAFVPEASMGTAIEMWEAHRGGRVVISISPLEHNWAVRFLSHARYRDVAEFEAAVVSGALADLLGEPRAVISSNPAGE